MSYGPKSLRFHCIDSCFWSIVAWWLHTKHQDHISAKIYLKFKLKMQLKMSSGKRKPFLSITSVFINPVSRCVSLEAPVGSGIPRADIQASRPDTRDWCASGLIYVPLQSNWRLYISTKASHYSAKGCLEEALLVDDTTSRRHSVERQRVLKLPGHCY